MSPSKKTASGEKSAPRTGLRIAVAVQPPLFCEALSRQLGSEPDLVLVGRACLEGGLKKLLAEEKPQVLVFGYEGMGGPNAESIIHRLRRAAPATRILVLATRTGDETVERVLRAGASGRMSTARR